MPSQVRIVDLPHSDPKEKEKDDKSKSSTSRKSKPKPTATADRDLRTRLENCFTRIAEAAEGRGDEELAAIIREDSEVMASGLVSLTRPFTALRAPVLLLLAVIEPLIAFSRLARLMLSRMMYRRTHSQPTEPEPSTPLH